MRRWQRGQSALETAVAVGGLAIMLTGSLRMWSWFDQTLVHRQQGYQITRAAAGGYQLVETPEPPGFSFTFGMPNPYVWEPLELFTPRPPGETDPAAGQGFQVCPEGRTLYEQSQAKYAEMLDLNRQAREVQDQAEEIGRQLEDLGKEYQKKCIDSYSIFVCPRLRGEIDDLNDDLQPLLRRAERLNEQAKAAQEEAEALSDRMYQVCQDTLEWE